VRCGIRRETSRGEEGRKIREEIRCRDEKIFCRSLGVRMRVIVVGIIGIPVRIGDIGIIWVVVLGVPLLRIDFPTRLPCLPFLYQP